MKKPILLLLGIFVAGMAMAQQRNPHFDPAVAKKYNSPPNGMKAYVLVILRTGSNTRTDKAYRDSCFAGHMQNIRNLVAAGKMVVAGPLEKNDHNYRGIFIFQSSTLAQVDSMLQTDPTIPEKIFVPELYEWYGSAALPAYLEVDDKIWEKRGN
ncbi:MAG: hypothetical protein LWW85_06610 [Marinilabiliales bacterium]|nr:hypothetical protein [Marinilabiliales bacterium]